MKPINSPTRTMSLIGLSVLIHGAVFWTVAENVSLHKVAQIIEETHEQANRSELWEKVSARNQSVEVDLAEVGTDAHAVELKEDKLQEKKSEKEPVKKDFAFKKVESVHIAKEKPKAIKKIATVLPEKEKGLESSEINTLPKQTVDVAAADISDINDDNSLTDDTSDKMNVKLVPAVVTADEKTEAKAQIETTPEELKEVEDTNLLSELKESAPEESEDVRSYLSLQQASGNQAPQYPLEARKQGLQGRVVLKYFVTEEGAVKDISVEKSSGFDILDNEAVRAISSFRFYPGQSGWAEHPVKFSLNKNLGASNSN